MSLDPRKVFDLSDGSLTKAFYADLMALGPLGDLACNLFRAQKTSSRAKVYRGRGYKQASYETKAWAMGNICKILPAITPAIRWGWRRDPDVVFGESPSWVLYVDIPQGQVSFHSPSRGEGPDYPGEFAGAYASEERIIQFCRMVLRQEVSCAVAVTTAAEPPPQKLVFGQRPEKARRARR